MAVLLLLILCIAAVVIWDNGRRHREAAVENTQNKVDNEGEKIYYDNQWYRLKDNLETVLIMGEDKFEAGEDDADYVNTRQTDFLLLLILDKTNQSCQILQLNRDTMTDIESYGVAGKSTGHLYWPAGFGTYLRHRRQGQLPQYSKGGIESFIRRFY